MTFSANIGLYVNKVLVKIVAKGTIDQAYQTRFPIQRPVHITTVFLSLKRRKAFPHRFSEYMKRRCKNNKKYNAVPVAQEQDGFQTCTMILATKIVALTLSMSSYVLIKYFETISTALTCQIKPYNTLWHGNNMIWTEFPYYCPYCAGLRWFRSSNGQ